MPALPNQVNGGQLNADRATATAPVRASILIPTHNRPGTLRLSVASALAQTVSDIEVIIIGDGVIPATRTMARRLAREDPRVVFLDLPKGENHGEVHRDTAIRSARSDAIFYLCDDDLLMPEHVADLLELLENGRTFVQSLNGWIDLDGAVHRYPGSLGSAHSVAWVMDPRWRYNFISLTGTAHSRRFYDEVGQPWSTTPADDWPDRHQWRKMLDHPGFSGATSLRMTALQFPAAEPTRGGVTVDRQVTDLSRWAKLIEQPGAQARIDRLVAEGTEAELAHYARTLVLGQFEAEQAAARLEDARIAAEAQAAELSRVTQQLHDTTTAAQAHAQAQAEEIGRLWQWHEDVQKTMSWRITRPLRAIRRRF